MKLIDHIIEYEDFIKLKDEVLNMPWFLNKEYDGKTCFTHQFYEDNNSSIYFELLDKFESLLNVRLPIHIFGKLYTNTGDAITHEFSSELEKPASTAIYFLNSCNAFVELDDGTQIDAVENSVLMFDGTRNYKITQCTDEKIFSLITFNYF
jgi:hypothetical protein